jgi:glycosyltransferase involved in cell wall biosynthesis
MASSMSKEFDMRLMANSNHRSMNKKGVVDAHNILSFFAILGRLVWTIFSFRPRVVQVETAGGIGFLKQSVYVIAAKLMLRKVIVSLHCANAGEPLIEFDSSSLVAKWYCGWILRMCSAVKLLSPQWIEEFSVRWGLDSENVMGVRNCLDTMFPWGSALSCSSRTDGFTVVSVGSVGERKGSFLLIEAVKRLCDANIPVSLLLIGPEEKEGSMAALFDVARICGVQDVVHFMGGQSREKIFEELVRADVFALPSYAEGMPYSIIEALAIGCPVIASDVGAVKDIIVHKVTGLLINAGSVDELAGALTLLAKDNILREKLALQGNKFSCDMFGINNLEGAFRSVYEKLIK